MPIYLPNAVVNLSEDVGLRQISLAAGLSSWIRAGAVMPQQRLNFMPLPQGQGALRPTAPW
jgi:hypothetical protein